MDVSTFLLVMILGLLMGGMTLMLAAGYVSTERAREQQEQARRAEAATAKRERLAVTGFFASWNEPPRTVAFVFDDGVVRQIESHLRSEQQAVANFVHHPSVDNLYREPAQTLQLH